MATEKQMTLSHAWFRLMSQLGGPGRGSHLFKWQDGRALIRVFENRMKRR